MPTARRSKPVGSWNSLVRQDSWVGAPDTGEREERSGVMDSYFEFSEEFIREQIIGGGLHLNAANQWLSTTQLLYRESRRRGWNTRRLGEGIIGFFDGDELITLAKGLVTAAVGFNAESVCRSKAVSKELFSLAGLPVPCGARFERSARLEAWEFVEGIEGAVVVKPVRFEGAGCQY